MTDKTIHPKPLMAAAAGLVAGLVASFAMDRFQALITSMSATKKEGEPATEKAANHIAEAVTGSRIPASRKSDAGQIIHYSLGAALGVTYALAAEYFPKVTTGHGGASGLATAATLDEVAVPMAGLGKSPLQAPLSTHAYTVASHIVFGATTETIRRLIMASAGR